MSSPSIPHQHTFIRWLCWFGSVNGLAAALITALTVDYSLITNWRAGTFLLLALPGHFLFLAVLLSLPAGLVWLLSGRRWGPAFWLATASYAIGIVVVYLNFEVFQLYRFHLNSMVWNLLAGGAAGQILSFSPVMWLLSAAVIFCIVAIEAAVAIYLRRRSLPAVRLLVTPCAIVMVVSQLMYAWHSATGYSPVTAQLRHIPWAQPVTARRFLRDIGVTVAQETDLPAISEGLLDYPKGPLQCDSQAPLNIVILMVDSLRFDMLNEEIMPHSHAFAQRALRFNRHFSTSNATRFGVFSFFYGLPGTYWFPVLQTQRSPVLMDTLLANSYDFIIHASAPLSSPEFDRTVFTALPRDAIDWPKSKPNGVIGTDRYVADKLIERLDTPDRDARLFFAFAFFDAPHAYAVPEPAPEQFLPMVDEVNYLALNNNYDATPFLNRYKASVHFNDALIGEILQVLEKRELLDNTVVLLTSDHGQEFNETGLNYWGHNSNFSDWQVRVPMVLYWPGEAPRHIAQTSSHVDVVPTLMKHALGCNAPANEYSVGRDLLSPLPDDRSLLLSSWSRNAVRHGGLIYQFERYGDAELYDQNYRRLDSDLMNRKHVLEALHSMGVFYK